MSTLKGVEGPRGGMPERFWWTVVGSVYHALLVGYITCLNDSETIPGDGGVFPYNRVYRVIGARLQRLPICRCDIVASGKGGEGSVCWGHGVVGRIQGCEVHQVCAGIIDWGFCDPE